MILKYIVKENKYQSINQILKQKFKISARLQHKLITSKQIFLNGNQADSRIAPQINDVITVNLDFNEESENIDCSLRADICHGCHVWMRKQGFRCGHDADDGEH